MLDIRQPVQVIVLQRLTAARTPMKNGDIILGWIQRGTIVKAEEALNGFVRITVGSQELNRRRRGLIVPPAEAEQVSGWASAQKLQKLETIQTGNVVPLSGFEKLFYSIVNSYNGGLGIHRPLQLATDLKSDSVWNSLQSKQHSEKSTDELQAALTGFVMMLDDEIESTHSRSAKKMALRLRETLAKAAQFLEQDQMARRFTDKEFVAELNSHAADNFVGGAASGAGIGFGIATGDPNLIWHGAQGLYMTVTRNNPKRIIHSASEYQRHRRVSMGIADVRGDEEDVQLNSCRR